MCYIDLYYIIKFINMAILLSIILEYYYYVYDDITSYCKSKISDI